MAWKRVSNLEGKVYIPDIKDALKKHSCRDCFACQNCSEDRCAVCKAQKVQGAKVENSNHSTGS